MELINKLIRLRKAIRWLISCTPLKSQFGYCAPNASIFYPLKVYYPKGLYLYENTRIMPNAHIINSPSEKVVIKKYSEIAANTTFVTNSHVSTLKIPQFLLGPSHFNDKSKNIIVEEDCWIGTGVILLPGAHLGRGCIVGAGSIVNKDIPPYAVVVGAPTKIIAVKFSTPQIIEHEKALYTEDERLSKEYLEDIFEQYFSDKKVYGKSCEIDDDTYKLLSSLKNSLKYVEPQ